MVSFSHQESYFSFGSDNGYVLTVVNRGVSVYSLDVQVVNPLNIMVIDKLR